VVLFRMGLFARLLGRVKLEERTGDGRTGLLSELVVLRVQVSWKACQCRVFFAFAELVSTALATEA
jgi:hypothetical protein